MMRFSRFISGCRGSISVMFALSLVGVVMLTGSGFDFVQVEKARSALQDSLDGAVLAAAADTTTDSSNLQTLGDNYLKGNQPPADLVKAGTLTISFNEETNIVSGQLTGTAPTTFAGMFGVTSVALTVTTAAKRGGPGPVEMVLALDTTNSMDSVVGTEKKITTLKKAATSLINTVTASDYAKMGIVPFSAGMMIGKDYKDESWVFPKPTVTVQSCTTITDKAGKNYSCTTTYVPCIKDGFPDVCKVVSDCKWEVEPVTHKECKDVTNTWNGCVSVRKGYEASIDSPTDPKYPWTGNACPQQIMDLSSSKSDLTKKINDLIPALDTYIPLGLLWAWNMLTPEAPLTSARTKASMAAVGGQKVIVLMTDGMNSLSPSFNPFDGSTALYSTTDTTRLAAVDNTLKQLCVNVKNDGIILYTVAFAVDDENIKSILKTCASDATKYFDATDSAKLIAAFADIGKSLQRVRLIK